MKIRLAIIIGILLMFASLGFIVAQEGDTGSAAAVYYPTVYEYPQGNIMTNDIELNTYYFYINELSPMYATGEWGFYYFNNEGYVENRGQLHVEIKAYEVKGYPDDLVTYQNYLDYYDGIFYYWRGQGFSPQEAYAKTQFELGVEPTTFKNLKNDLKTDLQDKYTKEGLTGDELNKAVERELNFASNKLYVRTPQQEFVDSDPERVTPTEDQIKNTKNRFSGKLVGNELQEALFLRAYKEWRNKGFSPQAAYNYTEKEIGLPASLSAPRLTGNARSDSKTISNEIVKKIVNNPTMYNEEFRYLIDYIYTLPAEVSRTGKKIVQGYSDEADVAIDTSHSYSKLPFPPRRKIRYELDRAVFWELGLDKHNTVNGVPYELEETNLYLIKEVSNYIGGYFNTQTKLPIRDVDGKEKYKEPNADFYYEKNGANYTIQGGAGTSTSLNTPEQYTFIGRFTHNFNKIKDAVFYPTSAVYYYFIPLELSKEEFENISDQPPKKDQTSKREIALDNTKDLYYELNGDIYELKGLPVITGEETLDQRVTKREELRKVSARLRELYKILESSGFDIPNSEYNFGIPNNNYLGNKHYYKPRFQQRKDYREDYKVTNTGGDQTTNPYADLTAEELDEWIIVTTWVANKIEGIDMSEADYASFIAEYAKVKTYKSGGEKTVYLVDEKKLEDDLEALFDKLSKAGAQNLSREEVAQRRRDFQRQVYGYNYLQSGGDTLVFTKFKTDNVDKYLVREREAVVEEEGEGEDLKNDPPKNHALSTKLNNHTWTANIKTFAADGSDLAYEANMSLATTNDKDASYISSLSIEIPGDKIQNIRSTGAPLTVKLITVPERTTTGSEKPHKLEMSNNPNYKGYYEIDEKIQMAKTDAQALGFKVDAGYTKDTVPLLFKGYVNENGNEIKDGSLVLDKESLADEEQGLISNEITWSAKGEPKADDTTEPADGGDDTEPADGGDDTVPADGGDDTEPTDGGDDTEPADGGDDTEPADGGDDTEPADGGNEEGQGNGGNEEGQGNGGNEEGQGQ